MRVPLLTERWRQLRPDNGSVSNAERATNDKSDHPTRRTGCVAEISLSVCLVLLVSVPVLVVEESWHGHPMIDDPNYLWLIPALLVALAFWFGGALLGFRSDRRGIVRAVIAACIALSALMVGDLIRRCFVVHQGLPQPAVLRLWVLGVAAALTMSLIGSILGRRWSPRSG